MSFINEFIEKEKTKRRDFLLRSVAGAGSFALASSLGMGIARAANGPTNAWSYRNRTNPYWNTIVSGSEAFMDAAGLGKEALLHLINEGSSEKSLADVKALMAKTSGNLALAVALHAKVTQLVGIFAIKIDPPVL